MKNVLVLRHVAAEDLGGLLPLLERARCAVRYFDVGIDSFLDNSPLDTDLVIVLGGPISVYDSARYPFLTAETSWLRARIIEDLPTLGIGMGAQLMAAALHAKVYPDQARRLGWAPVALDRHGAALPALEKFLHSGLPVWHWHGDTFDVPAGARLLASDGQGRSQAFGWGERCLALQFHPEFDPKKLEQWLIGHGLDIASTPGASVERLRADTLRHGDAACRAAQAFLRDWLTRVLKIPATTLLPKTSSEQLRSLRA